MLEMGLSGLMSGEGKQPAASRSRSSALPRLYARSGGWNKTAKDRLIYAPSEKRQPCKLAAARHPTVVRSWTLTFSAQGGLLVNTCFGSFKTSQRNAAVDASAYRFMGETLIE